MQSALDPLQVAFFCGCHLARDPSAALARAGFTRLETARFSLCDRRVMAAVLSSKSASDAVAAVRAAAADGGAGWQPGTALQPHFLLSPHLVGVATA